MPASPLRQVYESLIELPAHQRRAALDTLSLPEEQRRRLEAMLSEDISEPALLRLGADTAFAALNYQEGFGAHLLGSRVGPFELMELLGEGGSALVFRATRPAGAGTQTVALKVLRTGLASPDAERRLQREQSILAQLSHPGIARLIEGGGGPSGLPYIAMEFVDGAPITRAADVRGLGFEQRLDLILRLCRIIDAAHASLVVHCDLKPSNVFLDRQGELKVLDFGIARLIEAGREGDARTVAFTPEYAAPEQFLPGAPTTAVDVFALGVMLSELLTGERLRGDGVRASDAARNARSLPLGLPAARELARRLEGDLDAILATATAPQPADRYRSADALGDDLRRYLQGLPVAARPASRWLLARKFVRRHRGAVALTSTLLLGLLGSLGLAQWNAYTAQRAADEARAQARRADTIRDAVFDLISQADPVAPGRQDITIAAALEGEVRRLLETGEGETRGRLELLDRYIEALNAQGRIARALEAQERLLPQTVAAFGADDPLTHRIAAQLARFRVDAGRYDQARVLIDAELARLPAAQARTRENLLRRSAVVAWRQGDAARARRESEAAAESAARLDDDELLHESLSSRAAVLLGIGDVDAAVAVFEDVLVRSVAAFGEQHEKVALAAAGLARGYRRQGDLIRAEAMILRALAVDAAIYEGDHWVVSNHLNALLQIQIAQRKFEEALASATESARIMDATLPESHRDRLLAQNEIGFVLTNLNRFPQARAVLEPALARATDMNAGAVEYTLRGNLAQALFSSGEARRAASLLDENLARLAADSASNSTLIAKNLERRTRVAIALAAPDVSLWLEKLVAAEAVAPASDAGWWTGRTQTLRALADLAAGDPHAALANLEAARKAMREGAPFDAALPVEYALLLAQASLATGAADAPATLAQARAALRDLAYPPQYLLDLERRLAPRH